MSENYITPLLKMTTNLHKNSVVYRCFYCACSQTSPGALTFVRGLKLRVLVYLSLLENFHISELSYRGKHQIYLFVASQFQWLISQFLWRPWSKIKLHTDALTGITTRLFRALFEININTSNLWTYRQVLFWKSGLITAISGWGIRYPQKHHHYFKCVSQILASI